MSGVTSSIGGFNNENPKLKSLEQKIHSIFEKIERFIFTVTQIPHESSSETLPSSL